MDLKSLSTDTKELSFEADKKKMGRPPVARPKADKVKKVFFTAHELEQLEQLKTALEDERSFSIFLKELIFKGVKND